MTISGVPHDVVLRPQPSVCTHRLVANLPSQEQHRALLDDCWAIARALPTSGVLDRGRRPYRAIRFERKLTRSLTTRPACSSTHRGMARRTSDGLESLVEYNRLDLSVEMLILDESAPYASLFTPEDRAAAQAKLGRQAGERFATLPNPAAAPPMHDQQREGRIAMLMSQLSDRPGRAQDTGRPGHRPGAHHRDSPVAPSRQRCRCSQSSRTRLRGNQRTRRRLRSLHARSGHQSLSIDFLRLSIDQR